MKGEEEDLKDVKSGLNRIETDLLQKRLASPLGITFVPLTHLVWLPWKCSAFGGDSHLIAPMQSIISITSYVKTSYFHLLGQASPHFTRQNRGALHADHISSAVNEHELHWRQHLIPFMKYHVALAGAVQGSIAREGVAWKQGTLAMPRIVGEVISLIQQVLEKLAALELMLAQKPIVSGRFSGRLLWMLWTAVWRPDERSELQPKASKRQPSCVAHERGNRVLASGLQEKAQSI